MSPQIFHTGRPPVPILYYNRLSTTCKQCGTNSLTGVHPVTFDLYLPMNTNLFTRASFPHSVEYSLSNSSYTPWTIILLESLVTDTTPCVCVWGGGGGGGEVYVLARRISSTN